MNVACPACGEAEDLRGERSGDVITLQCVACGHVWPRDLVPRCETCGGEDVEAVPLAILEKGRGTQLSIIGTRTIHLCYSCDAAALATFHKNRPNPLMPDELPTVGKLDDDLTTG